MIPGLDDLEREIAHVCNQKSPLPRSTRRRNSSLARPAGQGLAAAAERLPVVEDLAGVDAGLARLRVILPQQGIETDACGK
jgi:hypothetical protein